MILLDNKNFYPTPLNLIERMLEEYDGYENNHTRKSSKIKTLLEPSAGKGDIVDYIEENWRDTDIDCIEMDTTLQATLKGKKYRVVYDDFLTYKTYKKYDLIVMNPPFDNGEKHLLKALELQQDGGKIICLLNAETLRNPYSNQRKVLVNKLEELNAEIEFIHDAFIDAERKTNVEVAIIKVEIPEQEYISDIFENMREAMKYEEIEINEEQKNALVSADFINFIKSLILQYETEIKAGIKLIREYYAMKPHILNSLKSEEKKWDFPIIKLEVLNRDYNVVNNFVREVRRKYWDYLLHNKNFIGKLTSNLRNQYFKNIDEMSNYEFSIYNILTIREDMHKNINKAVEETILSLFDELSNQYHYNNETSKNIHYYNGWKTNKCWKINNKVIIPFYMRTYKNLDGSYKFLDCYEASNKMEDITKIFDYLDCGQTEYQYSISNIVKAYFDKGEYKNIPLKYFNATFYKKGTCHITFTNLELLDKFNLFGSQRKGWLPPNYGKKPYIEMDKEEQEVVKEFSGSIENYNKIYTNQDYYLVSKQMLLD